MDILFLDANILFSAAYRAESKLNQFWKLPKIKLVTSQYAVEEALRNLPHVDSANNLHALLDLMHIIHVQQFNDNIPEGIKLRDKDRPILSAAILAKATYLITGDYKDFGAYFGKNIAGITILPPTEYFKIYTARS